MERCPNCKVGKMTQVGCHSFCDNCDLVMFQVTDDYVEACLKLVAVTVSNAKFATEADFEAALGSMIATHTPQLDFLLSRVARGLDPYVQSLYDRIKTHAVGIEIETPRIVSEPIQLTTANKDRGLKAVRRNKQ